MWLLCMVLGIAWIARAHYSADLSAFLPASPDTQQRVLIDQLRSGTPARTLLLGIEGGDAARRAEASRDLAGHLRESGRFEQVQNGAYDDAAWQRTGAWLLEHRYQLSPNVAPERFTEAGLRAAIDDTLGLLGTPAGAAVKGTLERDPTGELTALVEGLVPATAPRLEQGVWVSRTQPRALLLLTTRAAGADLDGQAAALQALDAAFARWQAQGLVLRVSGAPLFAVQSREKIQREVVELAVVGTLVMGVLLTVAFASWRALLVAFLPVASGVVAGIVAVSLAFGTVHGITLGFGSTLIGEAVDYAIYYLIQARAGAARGGWRHWLAEGWPTVRLGLLTSVCGFAALVFSGFPGLAQLGVFSVAGLCGAAACTRWVLPVLMPAGAAGSRLRQRLGAAGWRAVRRLPALRWPLRALGIAAAAWLAVHHAAVWRGDLASLSPVSAAAQALDASLRDDLSASDARLMVIAQGASRDAALQAAEAAAPRLEALAAEGVIAGYDSPARLLPSAAVQDARRAALPVRAELARRLDAATAGGPMPAARLAPFLDDVDAARRAPPVTAEGLRSTALGPVVDALLFQGSGAEAPWFALLPLTPSADRRLAVEQVAPALHGLPGVQVLDIKQQLDRLYGRYLHEALLQALLGAAAVVLLLGFYLRSARRLLAVCEPLLFAVLITLSGLAALQLPLGILHLVGLLLVVAVGSNYALFFDQLQVTGNVDDDTLASLLLANATTVVSFGLIGCSSIPALSAIGQVVAPGALLAMLLSACFGRPPR
jgi:predicted exporter